MKTQEAVKLVLWPRETKEIEGEQVYHYAILGVVMTNRPIDWPNESVVMQGAIDAPLTELLDRMKKQAAPCNLGDASNALLTVSRMTPDELEDFEEQ